MIDKKDLEDIRLSRPVSVTDLWDIDDRIDRLEALACRLEKVLAAMIQLYQSERVKGWELILREMMEKEELNSKGVTHGSKRNHRSV